MGHHDVVRPWQLPAVSVGAPEAPGSCKKLRKIWVDGAYSGRSLDWVTERFRFALAVVVRPKESRSSWSSFDAA
jgi:hypothetical protein